MKAFRLSRALQLCCLMFATVLLNVLPSQAETPQDVLKELLAKIKSRANPSPVVDYVDWNDAFTKLPADQRTIMGINGPEEMKTFYRKVLENPTEMMRQQLKDQLASLPAEQRPLMEQSMKKMEQALQEKQDEMTTRIKGTTYEIGDAKVNGNNATVRLRQTFQGETKEEDVAFVKSGDRWLLPSLGFVDYPGASEGAAPPAPPAPQP